MRKSQTLLSDRPSYPAMPPHTKTHEYTRALRECGSEIAVPPPHSRVRTGTPGALDRRFSATIPRDRFECPIEFDPALPRLGPRGVCHARRRRTRASNPRRSLNPDIQKPLSFWPQIPYAKSDIFFAKNDSHSCSAPVTLTKATSHAPPVVRTSTKCTVSEACPQTEGTAQTVSSHVAHDDYEPHRRQR